MLVVLASWIWVVPGVATIALPLLALLWVARSIMPAGYRKTHHPPCPDTQAGQDTAALIKRANEERPIHEIDFVSGELNPYCWEQIAPELEDLIADRKENLSIRFIVHATVKTMPDQDDHVICDLARRFPKVIAMRKARRRPGQHYMIIDKRILRLEHPHEPLAYLRESTTWENSTFKVQAFVEEFEAAWAALEEGTGLPDIKPMTDDDVKRRNVSMLKVGNPV